MGIHAPVAEKLERVAAIGRGEISEFHLGAIDASVLFIPGPARTQA